MTNRARHRAPLGAIALVIACSLALPVSATAAPGSGTAIPAPAVRRPPDTRSAIDVPTDPRTESFRRELAEKQARLDEFMAQLDALDRELEIATEQYNAAVVRLEEMRERVESAKADLATAQQAYDLQLQILEERAEAIYKDGELAAIEVLLGSKSASDLIARIKFLNTIGVRDADIARSLKGQKELLEQQLAVLKQSEDEAAALEFELKARQIEIMLRIQERQQMLAEAQADLLALLDAEAARRREEEAELLRAVLSGASEKGIVVEPGSPVETALAYHGVPYLWGGETPRGFDCSGLVLYVFRQHGVDLPHYSGSQFLMGEKVAPAALQPGDVVFFGSPVHHVGIYIGGGYYIHAPRTGDFVKISRLADRRDYAGARRYPWVPRVGMPDGARTSTAEALGGLAR